MEVEGDISQGFGWGDERVTDGGAQADGGELGGVDGEVAREFAFIGDAVEIAVLAFIGFLETFSIWWIPEEPYQGFIIVAGILNGALVALLIAGLLPSKASLKTALLIGGIVGVLMALVTFLSKGGWVSWDAPYVVPAGLVTGTILGAVVRWMSRNGPTEG